MCQRISSPLNAATEGDKAKKKFDLPHFLLFHIDDKDFRHFFSDNCSKFKTYRIVHIDHDKNDQDLRESSFWPSLM